MRGLAVALIVLGGACGGAARGATDVDAAEAPDAEKSGDVDAAAPPPWTGLPSVACDDAADAPYAAVAAGAPGTIVACAPIATWDVDAVTSRVPAGVAVTTSVSVWRIAYATRRSSGEPAVSTALVYLPRALARSPAARVVIGHPSVGIADACAPSRNPDDAAGGLDALALPFAARGQLVIAPDLSGLGNPGVQAYLDPREQGGQLLDGARALRAFVAGTSDDVLLAGWSQGGGAALSAQALAHGAADLRVAGTIAIAPEWPARLGSFGYEAVLRDPSRPTFTTGLSTPAVAVLREYAWAEAALGPGHGHDLFADGLRADVDDAVGSQCLIGLGGWIQARMPALGDLLDGDVRAQVTACLDGGPGCAGVGAQYAAFLTAPRLSGAPDEGPVLMVQGLADQIMPAASEAACDADLLRGDGVTVEACTDPLATHLTIMASRIADAIAWGEAALAGGARPACASTTLPACQP